MIDIHGINGELDTKRKRNKDLIFNEILSLNQYSMRRKSSQQIKSIDSLSNG
jgi:hypothetical protein